jgi:hypothetical protein
MSSHREAPEISKDPVADNTDTYAFVSPDRPDTVTIIANYNPGELANGGPNFYEFGDDVRYSIHVDNDGDGVANTRFDFSFSTQIRNPNTFLYNVGPIDSLNSANLNRLQRYSVTMRNAKGDRTVLASDLLVPPCNVGPRSTPNYEALAASAVNALPGGIKVFAGQRRDPFFVDLGSIFDLGVLRPFQHLHLIPSATAAARNAVQSLSVHTIAIQVPIAMLTRDGSKPTDVTKPNAVIGVWASASRRAATIRDGGSPVLGGPWRQVSRLGNPLFNEVIVPMASKDAWNRVGPNADSAYAKYVTKPELAGLLPVLYPGVFPNLAAYTKDRADLAAILLTGIPNGIVPGFQNFTGTTQADMLRLNVAIPPAKEPNALGIVGGDLAGFPNGRRLGDDVIAIELKAVAGATIPLVDPSFKPDGAAALLTDGTKPEANLQIAMFPYVGTPVSGYDLAPLTAAAS